MEAIGRLAGGVAHDFNNLLTVIKGHSGLMFERLDLSDSLRASSQQIEKAADRAASLTRQLLAFCRMQVLQPKVLDLNALVSDMGKMLKRLIREDIAFSFRPSNALKPVKVDPSQVEQVILNLIVNACDAMPQGGKLLIETHDVILDEQDLQARPLIQPGRYAVLVVSDTGCGMDAETKAHIFEPFFTTKEQGKGTGLGLATVYGVVKQSGGWIWVDSEPGRGARFEIYLPVVEKTEQTTPLTELVTPVSAGNSETVLIAEDEAGVRELASQFLASAGYRVIAAEDGRNALALAEQSGSIHLLLTDVVMPNMRGPELSKRLKHLYPNLKVVYMSGYLEYGMGSDEFLEDSLFLQKPFSREKLIQKIAEALGNRAPSESPLASLQHAS
jgi:two-component system, cell cycle sensor histidine kinase and response regulator CckA